MAHLGNSAIVDGNDPATVIEPAASNRDSLAGFFDTTGYLSQYSDIVAHLVFDHQVRAINTITRVGWEMRVSAADHRADIYALRAWLARELADTLLFVGE